MRVCWECNNNNKVEVAKRAEFDRNFNLGLESKMAMLSSRKFCGRCIRRVQWFASLIQLNEMRRKQIRDGFIEKSLRKIIIKQRCLDENKKDLNICG